MCLNPYHNVKLGILCPCNRCIECRIQHSVEWAYRVSLEASLYEHNCMVTLTYSDANLPERASLRVSDLQKFIKRVRKHFKNSKIRYFACGEYGEKYLRPHYHVIFFGLDFSDKYFFCYDKKGTSLFRSLDLEKLWKFGFSSITDVCFDVAKYVAIYLQKPPVDGRHRAFLVMSRRPGIGAKVVSSRMLLSDKIYLNGKYIKIPCYFLKILSDIGYDVEVQVLKKRRLENAVYIRNYKVLTDPDDLERFRKIKKYEKIFGISLDKYFSI